MTSDFDRFWETYPRKAGKQDARKAWKQTEKARPKLAVLLVALRQQVAHNWRDREARHIPYPATWLRAHGWEDEIEQGPVDPGEVGRPEGKQRSREEAVTLARELEAAEQVAVEQEREKHREALEDREAHWARPENQPVTDPEMVRSYLRRALEGIGKGPV